MRRKTREVIREILARAIARMIRLCPFLEPYYIKLNAAFFSAPLLGSLLRSSIDRYAGSFSSDEERFRPLQVGNVRVILDATSSEMAYCFFGNRIYEPKTTEYIAGTIQPGDTFVDIGANCGYFTVLAARLTGENGKVFSFEPQPENLSLLTKTISMNGCEAKVKVFPIALGSENQNSVDFFIGDSHTTNSKSSFSPSSFALNHGWLSMSRKISVNKRTFDSIQNELSLPCIDWMKIDVERDEANVLKGMQNTFKTCPPKRVIMETVMGNEAHEEMMKWGYRVTHLEVYIPQGSQKTSGNFLYEYVGGKS